MTSSVPVKLLTAFAAAVIFCAGARGAATGATLLSEGFSATATAPNSWLGVGNTCLTAGTSATPATSIAACGSNAAQDPVGQGALQLTSGTNSQIAMVVSETSFPTGNGLQVTFTDYSYNGSNPGADGIAMFFSDASKAMPTAVGSAGGSLGYASTTGTPGISNGYLGIGFDEYGGFSSATEGRNGGPGAVPETIAARGAASVAYPYLGGVTNASGQAVSLPFDFDQPSVATRPANAPTMRVVLTPAGIVTVAVDRHDGNGFVTYYTQSIVNVGNQPAVPANVYLGFTGSTGGLYNRHQIGGLVVSTAPASLPVSFMPSQIANLVSWYDPSNASTVTQAGGTVSNLSDLSGKANTASQATASLQPKYTAAGINNLGSLTFNGGSYLVGSNASFSTYLFNESTVFAVTNKTVDGTTGSLVWSGAYNSNPRWNLQLSPNGEVFDFNQNGNGERSQLVTPTGPAFWSAGGSISKKLQFLNKDGYLLSSSTSSGTSATGNYPLALGAMYGPTNSSAPFTGQLGEVLLFNRYLSNAETTEVEGYLACKWGLQNRLPANHPYRSSCPQGGHPASLPTPAPSGAALQDPPQVASVNGQLVFNVTASQNSSGAPALTYNGSAVPPTLRLLPGDTLVVNLTNNLPTPPNGAGYLNDTNLHYHGLHVNPNAPGDDSIDMMAMPGQSLHYQIVIPANHPSGLYWYHSHAHGEAERQNLSGMSGALIVDGISQTVPEIAQVPERILIVRDAQPSGTALPAANRAQVNAMIWAMRHGNAPKNKIAQRRLAMAHLQSGMSMNYLVRGRTTSLTRNPYVVTNPNYRRLAPQVTDSHCTGSETAVHALTLNGQTNPSIGIRPGEKQFWRVVNAGSDTYLDIAVDNTSMQILAADGVPLASVGNSTPTVTDYVLPPASRVEFFVRGPAAGTASYLRTKCFDAGASGLAMPATTLATINTASSPSDNVRPRARDRVSAQLKAHPRHVHSAAWLRAQAVTGPAQTITYSDQFTINGQAYNPSGPPLFYAQSGTTAVWTVVNNSSQVHTFHIHQIHFVVQSVTGGTASDQANVNQELDNVNVPAASGGTPGSVTLKMDFTDPTIVGTFLLHCHILSHEDQGMMAEVRVGIAAPMSLSQSSLTFASPTAAAQTVTASGGTAPYSVSGCAGVAGASVTNATVTVTPVGGGGCSLTIADSSGLVASVGVTVSGAASPVSVAPNSLSFASPSANALNATVAGGTAPYTVAGCSGIVTASISAQTLTAMPAAAGQCTLTVSDSANHTTTIAVAVNSSTATSSALDNLTFHQNNGRTGWYQAETALTVANVASTSFTRLATLAAPSGAQAFGKVYAQPLYVTNETVGNGTSHNLVIVATATDQVYAFDDQTMNVIWSRSFMSGSDNISQRNYVQTGNGGCPDMSPDVGITGTPVIDRSLDEMFVVVNTTESGVYHMRLHAISLKTGLEAVTPVEVSATVALTGGGTASTSAQYNFNRSGLLEANGSIYVPLATHCDFPANGSHGWVLAYSTSNLQASGNILNTTDGAGSYYLGSPWMGGYGPAADAQGNIYFATGNGPWDGVSDFSMSIMKVPGNLDLSKSTSFTPNMELGDSNADQDLGSGGVMLLPDGLSNAYPHLLIQGGKCGVGSANGGTTGCQKYILNRDSMGGKTANDAGALWHADTGGGQWGGPAFFQDSAGTSHVVYGDGSTAYPFTEYNLNLSPVSLSVQSSTTVPAGCLECRDQGGQPIVSSNGTTAGTAIAWVLGTPGPNGGNLTLYAFDATNMSHMLQAVTPGTWTRVSGASYVGEALTTPLVANGKVYVPTDGSVAVYGL